ncbi:hypothetical protein HDV05_000095 [Chytridiales sp. JEL 0842]|nr:hypothetical protein HDV05_000095 [Chytridiales sp. JEL 0842]
MDASRPLIPPHQNSSPHLVPPSSTRSPTLSVSSSKDSIQTLTVSESHRPFRTSKDGHRTSFSVEDISFDLDAALVSDLDLDEYLDQLEKDIKLREIERQEILERAKQAETILGGGAFDPAAPYNHSHSSDSYSAHQHPSASHIDNQTEEFGQFETVAIDDPIDKPLPTPPKSKRPKRFSSLLDVQAKHIMPGGTPLNAYRDFYEGHELETDIEQRGNLHHHRSNSTLIGQPQHNHIAPDSDDVSLSFQSVNQMPHKITGPEVYDADKIDAYPSPRSPNDNGLRNDEDLSPDFVYASRNKGIEGILRAMNWLNPLYMCSAGPAAVDEEKRGRYENEEGECIIQ